MATEKINLTEKHDTKEYKNTTILKPSRPKKKRRNKSNLGPDFVAPDAGWAWAVCIAAGFNNFSIYPSVQQYGLIYEKRMTALNFNQKEKTTIASVVLALACIVGIVNGAMFRRFTFRQVALVGGFLCFIGIFATTFATTFIQYIIRFSCTFGIGMGLSLSANSLAVNTYFKKKRRKATGFMCTIAGLGSIIFPHISTFLLEYYGAQGTILIISAIALNSVLCAITLQPVLWHTRTGKTKHISNVEADDKNAKSSGNQEELGNECEYCIHQRRSKHGSSYSRFPFIDEDPETFVYEITDMSMLPPANDNWCGFRHSPNYFNRECENTEYYTSKLSINNKAGSKPFGCTCAETLGLMKKPSDAEINAEEKRIELNQEPQEVTKRKMALAQKVVRFLDLDLLKDFTFVNLALGITAMKFGDINFLLLTPSILNSYHYKDSQISLAMSLLAGMDILVSFLAPFAVEKVKLGNRTLFGFGIIATTIARFIVTLDISYEVTLAAFALIGFGKGFRSIFSPLIIPSYVPLNRLPAASGMQLIFHTIFILIFGPILGIIRDATSFTVTIHVINALSVLALLLWVGESVVRRMQNRSVATVPIVAPL